MTTHAAPITTETSIIWGTLRVSSAAVAGGPTRRPNTSTVPTAWNEPITAAPIITSSSVCVSPGRMPSERALTSEKLSASRGR